MRKLPSPHCLLLAGLIAASGCQCADSDPGWALYEDFGFGVDVGPDLPLAPDMGMLPDPPREPEEIAVDVPLSHALNERTALAVDEQGTVYLGYHACRTRACEQVDLTLGRRARGGDWTFETVKEQRGTFGIDVAVPEEVVAAFLDPTDNTFKVARRLGVDAWEFRALGVRRTGPSDGLDITADAERMFVTFANERGDPVSLFAMEDGVWRAAPTLDIGHASAAYERGLGSDDAGNLYLVHQQGDDPSPWGVARYSMRDGEWKERTYYQELPRPRPSSLVVTSDGQLCIAGDINFGRVTITCGDMTHLERKRWEFDEHVALGAGGYSSMLEGSDGALYVAYPSDSNTQLRLARKPADSDAWTIETVFEKNAYGVSTIIDSQNLLVISYYTCGSLNCSLEVISRRQ